jgi:beta-N-acetylhexosaminidase
MSNLPELAGQLLIVGFEGEERGPDLSRLLRGVRPGGVIFFQRNIASAEQFHAVVSQVREVVPQPFLAMDLEGGTVDRFRDLLAPLPSAQDAARTGLARELGELAGRELGAFSLNLDFAPVLDLGSPDSQPILATRTAGRTANLVIQFAERFLAGLAEWRIHGCGKHFPGLGSGRKDSHVGMPTIEKTEEALWHEDLLPFRNLADQLLLIMVAHAWYPELEKALAPEQAPPKDPIPASLSRNIVTGLLRERIGYQGLVVCDDLEMGGVLEGRSIEAAAVAAVRAGCDILLVCRNAGNVQRVHEALVQEAEKRPDFRELLERSATRIADAKRHASFDQPPMAFANLEILRRDIRRLAAEIEQRLARKSETPRKEAQGL